MKRLFAIQTKSGVNSFKKLIQVLLILFPVFTFSQSINYKQSWLGSSTGTTPWVQNFINSMQVQADGTIYTECGWDEGSGGSRKGTYKDGKILSNHNKSINYYQVKDKNGKTWTLQNPPGDVFPTANNIIKCSDGREINDASNPGAIAISNDGLLMVGEFGENAQVRYYDISGTPKLDHTFGEKQGFLSGNIPGRVGGLRFREITGLGTDASGNIFVGMSSFYGGCKLQSFTPSGKLNWELNGLLFVDNGDVDQATDGNDIYTKSHHFVYDPKKPVGQEWRDTAYTLNRFKYTDDARLHNQSNNPGVTIHPSSTWIRYKNGKKFMVLNDMFNEQLRLYRFNAETDGEIAIPTALYAKRNVKPYLFNFKYFKLDDMTIQALSYYDKRGTSNETANIGSIIEGNYLAYSDIDFGLGKTNFTVSTTSPFQGGLIEIHVDSLDGKLIGKLSTKGTGGWASYQETTQALSENIIGKHKVFLLMKYADSSRWPVTQPLFGDWLWTDTNGDGQMNLGEYQSGEEFSNSGYWVDQAMNIWIYGSTIMKIPCEGVSADGIPIFNRSASVSTPAPTVAGSVKCLEYDSDHDIMYLISETKAARFSQWEKGNRTADWIIPISGSQSMSIAGDYLFTIHTSTNEIIVNSISNGKYAGILKPSGPIGLVDIPYGVRAYKRTNGEYMVLAEEDSKGKMLVYRFSTFNPNIAPTIKIIKPTKNQEIISVTSVPISAVAADVDGQIEKVELYIDGEMVAKTRNFNWHNPTAGKHDLYAKAFDNYGDSIVSDTIHVNVLATANMSIKSNDGINFYPNPAKDRIIIEQTSEIGNIDFYEIDDLNGSTIVQSTKHSVKKGNLEIDISGLSNGVYVLKVTSGIRKLNSKFVVNR